MIDIKNKGYLKQALTMYKTFSSIRAVEDNKWKLSYVFGNRVKLEKAVKNFTDVRGKDAENPRIVQDKDVLGYHCFECVLETREEAIGAADFLDNYLDEVPEEDTYDYPIPGDDC